MGKIETIDSGQAKIVLDNLDVRLFVKYKGNRSSEIRIWKLPKNHTLQDMYEEKNLYWAIYDDMAIALQGWFYKEGDVLKAIASKIEKCSNEEDLKRVCLNLENIISKGIPLDIGEF